MTTNAIPVPSPADYPTGADFWAAYATYRRRVDADNDARLLAAIAAVGGRTTTCADGYGPFDSCPVCD